jgi:hypothetical protein
MLLTNFAPAASEISDLNTKHSTSQKNIHEQTLKLFSDDTIQ